jgi:hypothetical protein
MQGVEAQGAGRRRYAGHSRPSSRLEQRTRTCVPRLNSTVLSVTRVKALRQVSRIADVLAAKSVHVGTVDADRATPRGVERQRRQTAEFHLSANEAWREAVAKDLRRLGRREPLLLHGVSYGAARSESTER